MSKLIKIYVANIGCKVYSFNHSFEKLIFIFIFHIPQWSVIHTWNTDFSSLQTRATSTYFMRTTFTKWTYCKLKRATGYMNSSTFDINSMNTSLIWYKSDNIAKVRAVNYFCIFCFAVRIGDLCCHIQGIGS